MILIIDLNDDEVEGFNIFKAIEYVWLYDDAVTQYDDLEEFKMYAKRHITHDKNSFVTIIDTINRRYEVINLNEWMTR